MRATRTHRASAVLTALAGAACLAATAGADTFFVDTPGTNNIDALASTGAFIQVGLHTDSTPVTGVVMENTDAVSWDSLYAWSNSVVTLRRASFTGFDMQAHDTSTINYAGGDNDALSLVTFDAARIYFSGGRIGSIGTGGGGTTDDAVFISGGTVLQSVVCAGGAITISGGEFFLSSELLPPGPPAFSFVSITPGGIQFLSDEGGLTAQYVGYDSLYGGSIWSISGGLADGGTLNGHLFVDVGSTSTSEILNAGGLTVVPAPGAIALICAAGLVARRRRR